MYVRMLRSLSRHVQERYANLEPHAPHQNTPGENRARGEGGAGLCAWSAEREKLCGRTRTQRAAQELLFEVPSKNILKTGFLRAGVLWGQHCCTRYATQNKFIFTD